MSRPFLHRFDQPAREAPAGGWGWSALAALLAAPFAVGAALPLGPKRSLTVTPFDPLVWLSACWLCLAWWRGGCLRGRLCEHLSATWPALLLWGVALASAARALVAGEATPLLAAKSLVQWAEYLLAGVLVMRTVLLDPAWRGRALGVLALAGAGALLSAAPVRFLDPETPVQALGYGLLGDRNTYGMAFVLLAGPLAVWCMRPGALRGARALAGTVAITAALMLSAAGGPFLAGVAALLIVFAGLRERWMTVAPALLVVAILLAGPRPLDALVDSVQVYVGYRDPDSGAQSREHTMRYYRWSANLEMLRHNPFLGAGFGQYQRHANDYYPGVPLPEGRTDRPETYDVRTHEPLSFGGFFLVGAELGVLGLAALALLLADLARRALLAIGAGDPAGWAVAASLCGLLLAGWFANPFTRACGALVAFLLALAWSSGLTGEKDGPAHRAGNGAAGSPQ